MKTPSPQEAAKTVRDVQTRAVTWISGMDTGISSKTIFAVMMGANLSDKGDFRFCYPHDPADFGRCHRLFELIPEWRSRLHEVAREFPQWTALGREWDSLTNLFLARKHVELYQMMRKLIEESRHAVEAPNGRA